MVRKRKGGDPGEVSDSADGQESEPLVFTMDNNDDRLNEVNAKIFLIVLIAAELVGLLAVILVIVWATSYLGGLGWENPSQAFNYHPIAMVIGMVFLYGNSILTYRGLRNQRKPFLKLLHAGINGLVFLLSIFGLIAAFSFHNRANIANLYSLHSWIGLFTVIAFGSQLIGGCVAFLWPGMAPYYRKLILPYHVYGGTALFALACGSCLTGITEKVLFKQMQKLIIYSSLPQEAYVLNFLGVSIVLFGLLVGHLVTKGEFKRKSLPEEQQIGSEAPMSMR